MAVIETLYGVLDGGEATVLGIIPTDGWDAVPSVSINDKMRVLPKGTVVGLEMLTPGDVINNSIVTAAGAHSLPGRRYWNELAEVCQQAGLTVAYLDNKQALVDYFTRVDKLRALRTHQRNVLSAAQEREVEFAELEDQIREINEDFFKAEAEMNEVLVFQRGSKIAENIQQYSPNVVVLNQGYADMIAFGQERLTVQGLEVGRYRRETYPRGLQSPRSRVLRGERLTNNVKIDPLAMVSVESLSRKLRAVREGRITTGGREPDFIGTWNLRCRPGGLFEVFVEETLSSGEVVGVIQDVNGPGDFHGRITDQEIDIVKRYRVGEVPEWAIMGPISYTGELEGNKYKGRYQGQGGSGDFVMNKGSRQLF